MPQLENLRIAGVNASTAGSNALVAAPGTGGLNVGGPGVGSITVWSINLEGAGANTLQFQSNANNLGGPITFTGAGSTGFLPYTGAPYYKARAGEALNLTLSTTAAITGTIQYSLG